MLRALGLSMTVVVLSLGSARADAPPGLGANAALTYWQAFAALPKLTDAEQKQLNVGCLTVPLDAHAREVVDRAAYALRMMHRGAALPRCDWGIGWEEEGIGVRLTHAAGARALSALACLRARLRFEEGKNAEAVDDIVAGMTLGRHVGRDGVYVMLLTGYAIEQHMMEALALYLPQLDAGTVKGLKARLDALPPGGNPATALRFEEKWALNWFISKIKEAKDKESLLALLSRFWGTPEKGRAFLEECGGTAEGVLKVAEETRQCYALTTKKLSLPLDQFEKEWAREESKLAGDPVFKLLFPAVDKVRRAQARIDVRRALLAAALAIRLDGRDALKRRPDPVIGGPFEYVPFEGGFELRSKLEQQDGKPVALTVGRRGK
jgi:hypothetical protein